MDNNIIDNMWHMTLYDQVQRTSSMQSSFIHKLNMENFGRKLGTSEHNDRSSSCKTFALLSPIIYSNYCKSTADPATSRSGENHIYSNYRRGTVDTDTTSYGEKPHLRQL